ncbi:hypothetical protein Patl1_07410 [Pistacia atlantica]|uniref:Uncharacterized protein n=1 Tax=Pistacia atlantica TaxID=434234 RepID=A0ACC1AI85_9ROSI|nr:hypothetical protein Patl1_07410 [Pistacia atlantica]
MEKKTKKRNPVAYITRATTKLGTKPAPFMAAFSSKGPNKVTPEIFKICTYVQPDITAPGVSVQPDWSPAAIKSVMTSICNELEICNSFSLEIPDKGGKLEVK